MNPEVKASVSQFCQSLTARAGAAAKKPCWFEPKVGPSYVKVLLHDETEGARHREPETFCFVSKEDSPFGWENYRAGDVMAPMTGRRPWKMDTARSPTCSSPMAGSPTGSSATGASSGCGRRRPSARPRSERADDLLEPVRLEQVEVASGHVETPLGRTLRAIPVVAPYEERIGRQPGGRGIRYRSGARPSDRSTKASRSVGRRSKVDLRMNT